MRSLTFAVSLAGVLIAALLLRRSGRRRGPARGSRAEGRPVARELAPEPTTDEELWESLTARQVAEARSLAAVNQARGMEAGEARRAAAALVHRAGGGDPADRARSAQAIAELQRAVRDDPALRERLRRIEEREQAEITAEAERSRRG